MAPSLRDTYRGYLRVFVLLAVLCALPGFAISASIPRRGADAPARDQWELGVAADGAGHVYVLYPQYGAAGCDTCLLPALTLVVSSDGGSTWQSPRVLTPPAADQFDPQIAVDSLDHRTVYATWLQDGGKDILLAKSVDFGQSWSLSVADRADTEADKPALAVRGQNVYIGFSRAGKMRTAFSHDGGIIFNSADVDPELRVIGSLAGGATVSREGSFYLAWAAYTHGGSLNGRVNLFVSQSADGGNSWTTAFMDSSSARPECAAYHCEWGYLGAQITVASDDGGTLYALWNSGPRDRERIYFASSTTAGETWSPKAEVSGAPAGAKHVLPMIAAGSAGDVRIAWMDSRHTPRWNAYFRNSTNGGATWSREEKISGFVPGYSNNFSQHLRLPFGKPSSE